MRDPKRIRRIIAKIAYIWESCPDLRFNQLMVSLQSNIPKGVDPFFFEDDEFEKLLNHEIGAVNNPDSNNKAAGMHTLFDDTEGN